MRWVAAVLLVGLLAGCTPSWTGAATGDDTTAATTTTTTNATPGPATPPTPAEDTALPPPPTSIDVTAAQQYCPGTIPGARGKPMNVVVVATAGGQVHCEEAFAVLTHYYLERREPDPGSAPIEVDGYACN